jgi:hypothetical protein
MLSPEIDRRFNRLLAFHEKGGYSDDELAFAFGTLATADNIGELLERLPSNLLEAVKRGIVLDNRQAMGNDYLHPEASPLDCEPLSIKYYQMVSQALLEPDLTPRRGRLWVVCLPSFQVEWALRLIGSDTGGYSLAVSVAKTQIWDSQTVAPVEVKMIEAPLPTNVAAQVCRAWQKMLLRVRHPESNLVGKDGVGYHFAYHGPDIGRMAGKTWSPGSSTAPGKLVALSHLLYQYVEKEDGVRNGLLCEIQQAAGWFDSLA